MCSRYYLFYTMGGNYTSVMAYAIVDCSSGSPVIAQTSQRVDNSRFYGGTRPGLAVSRPDANGARKLYVTSGGTALSYQLPYGGGIGTLTSLANSGAAGSGSSEAEVSPDGKWLVWSSAVGNSTSQVTLLNLQNLTPTFITPSYTGGATSGAVTGLEFSGSSDKLFIVGTFGSPVYNVGASVYTISTGAQATISTGSNTLASSQIELAFDGLLYAISGLGGLLTINPSTLAVAPSALAFSATPFSTPLYNSAAYLLPDQLDGENYTTYFGDNTPTLSPNLAVDGALLRTTSVTPVYSCKNLTLTPFNTSSPDISRFDVIISATDANGNLTGTYSKTYTNVTLPLNMAALDNGYLADPAHTGYYQVKLIGYNSCHSATTTARMRVSNLTPGSAGFAFNLCNGMGPLAASTSVTNPAILGAFGGGGVDISFSSGNYDYFQVQFAEYVNGSNNPQQFIPKGLLANIPGPGTTYSLSYLAGQAGLEPNYFQPGHAGYNLPYQLTLTVSNPCGTSPALVGYFQTSNILCRTVAGTPPVKAPMYPNPLAGNDTGHLRFTLATAQPVSLVLTDALTGQVRLTVLRDVTRPAGEQEVEFTAAKLPAGVYLYRLTTADGTTVGRILKAD